MTDLEKCTARIREELRRIVGDDRVNATPVSGAGSHAFQTKGKDLVVLADMMGGQILDLLALLPAGVGAGSLWTALTRASQGMLEALRWMDEARGRPIWLYTTRWITAGLTGPIVGMKIIEQRGLQFGRESYGPGFGAWASRERVESDLVLVNWLLGWYSGTLRLDIGRIEITRADPADWPAESPAQ